MKNNIIKWLGLGAAMAFTVLFTSLSAAAADSVLIKISISCSDYGGVVRMDSADGSETYSVSVGRASSAVISIRKSQPGTTKYEIYMESADGKNVVRDSSVYLGVVYVEREDDGTLCGTFFIEDSEGTKKSTVTFENKKKSSGSGSGSGGTGLGAATTGGSQKYSKPTSGAVTATSGSWELQDDEEHIWKFKLTNGAYASDGCYYILNPYSADGPDTYSWFSFDENERMNYGWWQPEGEPASWYFFHNVSDGDLGKMVIGWHFEDSDGRWYYLGSDGAMVSGWQTIDGYEYYFERYEDVPFATWASKRGGILHWIYDKIGIRSYGSMYIDELTKDGSRVDSLGRKVGWNESL